MITEIEELQADIDQLKNEQKALVLKVVADTERYTLDQRFKVWSECAIKKDEPWIIHAAKYPIIGQMVDDCFPYEYDKHKTYDWRWFLETAIDNFEEHQDPDFPSDEQDRDVRFPTQESIDALKEEMMTLNFGSFEMDW